MTVPKSHLKRLDLDQIRFRPVDGREPRHHPLDQVQCIDILWEFLEVQWRDDGALVGQRPDQLLGRQPLERFADRRTRNVEALRQPGLVDDLSRLQLERQNVVAQPFEHAERAKATRRCTLEMPVSAIAVSMAKASSRPPFTDSH